MNKHDCKKLEDFLDEIRNSTSSYRIKENTKKIEKCENAIWGNGKKGMKFWILVQQVQVGILYIGVGFIIKLILDVLKGIK